MSIHTVLIFDQRGEQPICFFYLDGNLSHLDGIYINQTANAAKQKKQDELHELLYRPDSGCFKHEPIDHFPSLYQPTDKVIVCGFEP